MSDDESSEENALTYHTKKCEDGDGWSHGFENGEVLFNGTGQLVGADWPRSSIIRLFEKENWRKMGQAIRRSSETVTRIDLTDCELTDEEVGALFEGEWLPCNCVMGQLNLRDNMIESIGIAHLLSFLKSRALVRELFLDFNNLGNEGARLVSEALNHVQIEVLDLDFNGIGDEGVESLLSAEHSSSLVSLHLLQNDFGKRGIDAISHFLGRDDTKLEALSVTCHNVDCARGLVDSISEYSKLNSFVFWIPGDDTIDEEQLRLMVPSLKELVCNVSSFKSLCHSNHSLCKLGAADYVGVIDGLDELHSKIVALDPTLEEAFVINQRGNCANGKESVIKRLRHKLRTFYFRGEFDVQPFAKMDANMMPNILELVTKTEILGRDSDGKYYEVNNDDLGSIYRLIRSCHLPELFSYPSLESKMLCLELENTTLKADKRMTNSVGDRTNLYLELEITKLEGRIEQLLAENKELRSESSTSSIKRPKTSSTSD